MFYQHRGIRQILLEGSAVYLKYWGHLTRPLVYPLAAQILGIALWVGLTYGVVDWLTASPWGFNIWLLWGGFILANIPGMVLFFDGFWRYLVWVSALNLMVRELVETGRCDERHPYYVRICHRAVDYTLIWTFLFGLFFIPVGLGAVPVSIFANHPETWWLGLTIGVIVGGVGLLVATLLMLLFSLVFQVFAYTPGSAGASLFRSLDLVMQNLWKTAIIALVALTVTQFALPALLSDVCDWLHITPFLSQPIHAALNYLLTEYHATVQSLNEPFLKEVFSQVAAESVELSQHAMRAIIFIVVSAFLLPLGACWFALLYGDLKTRLDVAKAPLPQSEKIEATV